MGLKGGKVVLRLVRVSDAERFVKWFNDPEVNKFLQVRKMTLKGEIKWIKDKLKNKDKNNLHFCIDTANGTHIGAISLNHIHPGNKDSEFGVMIGDKEYWDKGYGSEAIRVILDYAFSKLKLHRVYLTAYVYNQRAVKVYKRLGFKMEGMNREGNFWNGKYWNSYRMGILDREWKQKK